MAAGSILHYLGDRLFRNAAGGKTDIDSITIDRDDALSRAWLHFDD